MKKKLVLFNCIILTLAVVVLFLFGISINRESHLEEAEKEIKNLTEIYAANFNEHITENVPKNIRVTVVDDRFHVVADSEDQGIVGTVHTDREELEFALDGHPEVVTRYSDTLQKEMMYYAVKVPSGTSYVFVRVAIPVESIEGYMQKSIPTTVYVLLLVIVVSFVASIVATNSLVKPVKDVKRSLESVKNGTFRKIVPSSGDEEIDGILREINDIGEKLQASLKKTEADKEELNYILGNVSDGIVVLDEHGVVSVLNRAASEIFDLKQGEGKSVSILTSDETFLGAIDCGTREGKAACEWKQGGKTYLVSVRALEKGFVVAVLSEITAVKNAEQMRSEFFANASHELKTPLTAIKGFNDLITLETSEEKTKELSSKIEKEVSRILALLNDMLDLSRLEEPQAVYPEELSLSEIAQDVKDRLALAAENKHVSVRIEGDGTVWMEREHATELVKNLVENAIRYNNENGCVKVLISQNDAGTTLSVEDNGIGIEEEHQSRLFERFYRVNKSRSRETGGTGLGLAIVKHICNLYGTEPELHSKYGVGTTVRITFPARNVAAKSEKAR